MIRYDKLLFVVILAIIHIKMTISVIFKCYQFAIFIDMYFYGRSVGGQLEMYFISGIRTVDRWSTAVGCVGYFDTGIIFIFILPLNIISEVATPASMAFRLFGNVAGGMVITGLLYGALGSLSSALGLTFEAGSWAFSVFQVGIPAVLSVYFDLFSGCIQAYIFSMLTMVNVGAAAETE